MIVLYVVFLMLSPAALLVSCPTTAEPVTASSRPAGAAGRSVFQPVEDLVNRDPRSSSKRGCRPASRSSAPPAAWPSALVPINRGPMTGVRCVSIFLIPSAGCDWANW